MTDKNSVLSMNVEPVAWMDDGSTRNGSETTSYRVVSAETKAAMPKASSDNFNTPLYAALPAQLKGVAELVEVVEAMARFDGRNNNSHLKKMAKDALAAYGAALAAKKREHE